ncbi:MAG: hypothetical protein Q4D90_11475 [bacterium]|nr:hypothetical protein [bacterium]
MKPIPYYIAALFASCLLAAITPQTTLARTQIIPVNAPEPIISVPVPTDSNSSIQVSSLPTEEERPEINGEYKAGQWKDNTYINSWADYQITLPENCQKETIASSSIRSHYDFLALIPKAGVSLRVSYDDLKDKTLDLSITEEEFGELLIEEQGNNSDISDFETVTYGDRDYTHFSITHQNQLIQDFYVRRVSHYMMVLAFSYMPVRELHASNILDSLTYATDLD